MKKVKVIDLYNVRYTEMEENVNSVLLDIQKAGGEILDVKVIGEKLNQCAVFVYYRD